MSKFGQRLDTILERLSIPPDAAQLKQEGVSSECRYGDHDSCSDENCKCKCHHQDEGRAIQRRGISKSGAGQYY